MARHFLIGTALLLVIGCASLDTTTFTPITLNGQEKQLRTTTMTQNGQTITLHSVQSRNGKWRRCNPDAAGSCENAARSNARRGL